MISKNHFFMKSKNNYYLQNETHTSKNQENLAIIKKEL